MQIAIGIVLIISAIFLMVAVLMQSSKNHNLSGTIAGGAETFFGKSKGSTLDKKLSKLTAVVAVIFCVLVLVSYLLQDTADFNSIFNGENVTTIPAESTGDASADAETTPEDAVEGEANVDGEAETEAAAE